MAFQQPLSQSGQAQLKQVLARRSRRFTRKLGHFQTLKRQDQENVIKNKTFLRFLYNLVLASDPKHPHVDGNANLYFLQP